jgi:hypothetical protein
VSTFHAAVVEALLLWADRNDIHLIPYLVFTFFAAVRPEKEMEKLDWRNIDLGADVDQVKILRSVSKTSTGRWITLEPNAIRWLSEYQRLGGQTSGPVVPFSASTLRLNAGAWPEPLVLTLGRRISPDTHLRVGLVV